MIQRIVIEKWAENLEEVTIGQWLKREGETIAAGEVLCEIITDKITFEYTPETSGTVTRIYATERSVVPVGYVIALIADAGEAPDPSIPAQNEQLLAEHSQNAEGDLDLALANILGKPAAKRPGMRATPSARRIARQHHVSIEDVAKWCGTSTEMVREEDVTAYLSDPGGHND